METGGNSKLITCIAAQGKGKEIVERLAREKGVTTANVSPGRGRGSGSVGSIGAWDEVDILCVTVPAARADDLFAFIYNVGGLNQPRGGIMYQHALGPVTGFVLPELDDDAAI